MITRSLLCLAALVAARTLVLDHGHAGLAVAVMLAGAGLAAFVGTLARQRTEEETG